jgi:hypothetical protein
MFEYDEVISETITPLGFRVRITENQWSHISEVKHRYMKEKLSVVEFILKEPDMVRQSKTDASVFLFYTEAHYKRWLCAVVKRENGTGFLITSYITSAIKLGEPIWTK